MEKYKVYDVAGVTPRNRAEKHLFDYTQRLLAEPVDMTIEQVRDEVVAEKNRYGTRYPSHGLCRVSDLLVSHRIKDKPHLVWRSFAIYGRRTGMCSLIVADNVLKDANNGYAPAK